MCADSQQVWRRCTHLDLCARKLAAFTGLGALRDLDLQLVRVGQVVRGHAEAPRSHLVLHKWQGRVNCNRGTSVTGTPRSHLDSAPPNRMPRQRAPPLTGRRH
jgi:hypothetical protein